MIDIARQLTTVYREVGPDPSGEALGVLLRRRYPAPAAEVFAALTDPDRLGRWYRAVAGDLRAGGDFTLAGGPGGRILQCEPPQRLRLTWGAEPATVDIRLGTDESGEVVLELEHVLGAEPAATALSVGPGWDVRLLALDRFLRGEHTDDPTGWKSSEDVQRFAQHAISAWAAAVSASGIAAEDDLTGARTAALARYAPDVTT